MANPQLEDGYTRIANEILDNLISHRISGQEFQIVLYIIRKTYGFNKKCDFISMSQIAKATGIKRSLVARILKKLKDKHIIGVTQNDNSFVNCLYFSKDYERWKVLHKKITVKKCYTKGEHPVTQNDVKTVTQNDAHKRKKDTLTKEKIIVYPDWLPLAEFKAFKEIRQKIRKPMTRRAEELIILELAVLKEKGNDPQKVLEESIMKSYQGVFSLKDKKAEKIILRCVFRGQSDKICYKDCPGCTSFPKKP